MHPVRTKKFIIHVHRTRRASIGEPVPLHVTAPSSPNPVVPSDLVPPVASEPAPNLPVPPAPNLPVFPPAPNLPVFPPAPNLPVYPPAPSVPPVILAASQPAAHLPVPPVALAASQPAAHLPGPPFALSASPHANEETPTAFSTVTSSESPLDISKNYDFHSPEDDVASEGAVEESLNADSPSPQTSESSPANESTFWKGLVSDEYVEDTEENEEASKFTFGTIQMRSVFHPLLIPLSNVIGMTVIEFRGKQILYIGEAHGTEYCRNNGFKPMSELIFPYLQNVTSPLDFMLEQLGEKPKSIEPPQAMVPTIQRMAEKNINDSDFTILAQIRQLLEPYMFPENEVISKTNEKYNLVRQTFPKARVHWLEPSVFPDKTKGDRLMNAFMKISNYQSSDTNFSIISPDEENKFLQSVDSIIFGDNSKDLPKSKVKEFVKSCIPILQTAKCFSKCFERGANLSPQQYADVFDAYLPESAYNDKLRTYFFFQRFLMDIYTCCRILKTESGWYNNILIYAGDLHRGGVVKLLQLYGAKTADIRIGDKWCEHNELKAHETPEYYSPKLKRHSEPLVKTRHPKYMSASAEVGGKRSRRSKKIKRH